MVLLNPLPLLPILNASVLMSKMSLLFRILSTHEEYTFLSQIESFYVFTIYMKDIVLENMINGLMYSQSTQKYCFGKCLQFYAVNAKAILSWLLK